MGSVCTDNGFRQHREREHFYAPYISSLVFPLFFVKVFSVPDCENVYAAHLNHSEDMVQCGNALFP